MVNQVKPLTSDLARRVAAVAAALRWPADDGAVPQLIDGQSKAYLDDLTSALTRGAGRQQLAAEIERAHRSLNALALVFVDVDGLKTVNDTNGHADGDRLLVAVTSALRQSMRQYDLVVRYGGDEFLCALPGGGNEAARAAIQRAQEQLQGARPGASFSAGFAELLPDEQLDELICRADDDLYKHRARRNGRGLQPLATPSGHGLAPPPANSPGVACAACGECIPLSHFVVATSNALTRFADCPRCAKTTVIQARIATSS